MDKLGKRIYDDNNLSWKAKGIYHQILSMSKCRIKDVESLLFGMSSDGNDSLHTGILELERNGYIKQIESHDKKGKTHKECVILINPLIDFWNALPNVRKHSLQSKACKRAFILFDELRVGFDLSKLDRNFLANYGISDVPNKYTDDEIRAALTNVSKFLSPDMGYRIKSEILTKDTWKGSISLDDIIYSSYTGSSLFFICAKYGPPEEIKDEFSDNRPTDQNDAHMYEKYARLLRPYLDMLDKRDEFNLKCAIGRIAKAQKMLVEHNKHASPYLIGDGRGPLVFIQSYAEFLRHEYNIRMHRIGPGTRNWQRFLEYIKGEGVKLPSTIGII